MCLCVFVAWFLLSRNIQYGKVYGIISNPRSNTLRLCGLILITWPLWPHVPHLWNRDDKNQKSWVEQDISHDDRNTKHPAFPEVNMQLRTFLFSSLRPIVIILFSKQIQGKAHLSHSEDTVHRLMLWVHTFKLHSDFESIFVVWKGLVLQSKMAALHNH